MASKVLSAIVPIRPVGPYELKHFWPRDERAWCECSTDAFGRLFDRGYSGRLNRRRRAANLSQHGVLYGTVHVAVDNGLGLVGHRDTFQIFWYMGVFSQEQELLVSVSEGRVEVQSFSSSRHRKQGHEVLYRPCRTHNNCAQRPKRRELRTLLGTGWGEYVYNAIQDHSNEKL